MSNGIVFYIPGVVLFLAVVLKLSAGRQVWRDPLVASSSAILLIGSTVCVLSAPPTIRFVNGLTGVANFSAPLVYAGMTALSAAYLVLMTCWRGGPPEKQRRAALLVLGVYGPVIAGIWVLFSLADVPVERAQDLDTYYANTPYMREMIVLYLVAHTAATLILMAMSVSWLREVRGVTRTGLTLIVVGLNFDVAYQIVKYAALAARWEGVDWDVLSTDVSPPLVMLAGVTSAFGFALPRIGPPAMDNVRAWRRYRLLQPLRSELYALRAPAAGVIRWWDPPVVRLARQEIAIWDGVLVCSPYLDDRVRVAAYAQALVSLTAEGGSGEGPVPCLPAGRIRGTPPSRSFSAQTSVYEERAVDQAAVVAEAAMLAATRIRLCGHGGAEVPSTVGTLRSVANPHLMVGLSQALSSSPIVAEARRKAAVEVAAGRG